jgi:hypothetical protein
MEKKEMMIYQSANGSIEMGVRVEDDDVWLTQKQMSILFGKSQQNVSLHLKNIYAEEELDSSSTHKKNLLVQTEGGRSIQRDVDYYNLDATISVGYRVHSKEGVRFRQWATRVLKKHIVEGYTLNKDRLGNLENLYRYMKDTLTVTSMNINRLRIDSARQKDFAVLAEDIEKIKRELGLLRKRLK